MTRWKEDHYSIFSKWHEESKQFRTRMVFSHPLLTMPKAPAVLPAGEGPSHQPIEIDSDNESVDSHPDKKRKRDGHSVSRPVKVELTREMLKAKGIDSSPTS